MGPHDASDAVPPPQPDPGRRAPWRWVCQHQHCLLVLSICMVSLGLLWYRAHIDAQTDLAARLEQSADRIAAQIEEQFGRHEQLLQIGRALFNASDDITREDWRVFVESVDIQTYAPGALAMGYVERVPTERLRDFVLEARQEDPRFRIRPHEQADTESLGPYHYVIKFSEPADRNRGGWGVDVATYPLNKAAYDHSAASGRSSVAAGFSLTQVLGSERGMVMTLPVHADPGPDAGADQIEGWITVSVLLDEFLEAVWQPEWDGFLISLHTGSDEPRLIASTSPGSHATDPALVGARPDLTRGIPMFGTTFTLRLTPASRHLVQADTTGTHTAMLVGSLATALLTIVTWSVTRTRQKAVAIARQMTESLRLSEQRQRELARRAEQANHAKSEFLANMSHEIRTPMTAILGYADLIESGEVEDHAKSDSVKALRRAGKHLLTIINDVLDISKIESGHMEVFEEVCCVPLLIDDVLTGLRAQAEKKGLELRADVRGPVPASVRTDTHRVRQILINLVGNAVKFTQQGSVRVAVSHHEGVLRVEVEDTGVGIHPDKLQAVFRPFEQADNSSSRRHEGTGLGLTISLRLAELLGGRLAARSTVGLGSAFVLDIPAPAEPGSAAITSLAHRTGPDDDAQTAPAPVRGRVLLAEDGPDNQMLIGFILRHAGLEVDIVSNGREAVERLASDPTYDLLVTDMQMPEMDGYAAAAHLRAAGFNLPILALTAHAMAGDRDRCLAAGCDDYEPKPIDRASLINKVQHLIHRAEHSRAA